MINYSGFEINGYLIRTQEHDTRSTIQNSCVIVEAKSLHVASDMDKNLIYVNMSYYGVIEDIWELNYTILDGSFPMQMGS